MEYVHHFLKKFHYLLERLSSRPRIGGLHVSDSGLYFASGIPEERSQSLHLPVGVLREGRVTDPERFHELLTQFRDLVDRDQHRPLPVVVTLPAGLVYTQSFTVPNAGAGTLEETAALNLRMLSPLQPEQSYQGWHLLRELPDHFELLGAFVEKAAVDEIRTALDAAGFYIVAIEFPGLSLARVVRMVYRNSKDPLLVVQLSSDGLDLLIFWNGALYFDYFRSWRSMQGDAREISRERFETVIVQEAQKVVNFSLSRFQEAPHEAVLVAPGFEAELQAVLEEKLLLRVMPLELAGSSVALPWYPALGAAFRGEVDRSRDREISLAPVSSSDLFFEEQLIDFIQLWRGIAVAVLALFLVFFASASSLLATQAGSLRSQLEIFNDQSQLKQLTALRGAAERFNGLVRTIGGVRNEIQPAPHALQFITNLMVANQVSLVTFIFNGFTSPVSLAGVAPNYDAVASFKNALGAALGITDITLPLAQLLPQLDGSVRFLLSFRMSPPQKL